MLKFENMEDKSSSKEKSEKALQEERILEFWEKNKIFDKSLAKPSPKGEFVFFEGPPTANGRPGIHHFLGRALKDVFPRYKTMQGYHVRRKAGWDTHGLPVELEVEKSLGLKSKKEIEKYGIAAFNQKCKESVWKYKAEWEEFTRRIGFWLDQDHPYVTYENEYIESLWNIVQKISERKLLYKDYKVIPWCPRCGTGLSSHELGQPGAYSDVKDLSVYAKFKLKNQVNTFVLAWTTTPWTLPGNVALAVGNDIDYVKINNNQQLATNNKNEYLILGKERLSVIDGSYEIIEEMKGKDLVGLEYEPLYPFLKDALLKNEKGLLAEEAGKLRNAFKIYPADFVTTEDGTGVVHTAVMYGADDFELGTKVGLPKYHLVNDDGTFKKPARPDDSGHSGDGTGFLSGRFVRDPDVAVDIIKDLAIRGLLYKKEKYTHSYPHCWRCKTALIYYARDSWYIAMSRLREELVEANSGKINPVRGHEGSQRASASNGINWEPAHIKEGRFGDWLREIKDWAISRERYWGTPLPIFVCDTCKETKIIGSLEELKKHTKKSGNKYIAMRHGEAENNVLQIVSTEPANAHHLTENGKEQVKKAADKFKEKNFDLIFVSPFVRTRETAEIVRETIGLAEDKVIVDDRIREIIAGDFNGKSIQEYRDYFGSLEERFSKTPPSGENYMAIRERVLEFLYDLESKYQNKNILIITHDAPLWVMQGSANGESVKTIVKNRKESRYFSGNAEVHDISFIPLPHNDKFELDLHRPYIDEIILNCDCGSQTKRVKEVMDVWFDSGSMPFAQDHYPFENKDWIDGPGFPADFICEGLDQTRGWFYTLHAVSTILNRGNAFRNVICHGLILDAQGKKMSKSVGNVINPWDMIEKYGSDALRFWMYSANQPGDPKSFDEKTVMESKRQVFGLLYNILSFYELYRDKNIEAGLYDEKPKNILDKWILARLSELTGLVTENLDSYKILEPARAIKDFIGDLSTWYLRRSRDRIKDGDVEAKRTLYFVLKTLAKIMAPFAPFAAEDIWLQLRVPQNKESVHLTNWPHFAKASRGAAQILNDMEEVRKIVSLGLEARQKAGIKVRQPLQKLTTNNSQLTNEYVELIKDELNVKEVEFSYPPPASRVRPLLRDYSLDIRVDSLLTLKAGVSGVQESEVKLDTNITEALKLEGQYRELVRGIQELRKKEGLTPSDRIVLVIETDSEGKMLIKKFEKEIKKTVLAGEIKFSSNDGLPAQAGAEIKIDNLTFKIKIQK